MKQINTFSGGMQMDLDYSVIKDNQYVYAENVRITTNEGSSFGVIQNIEGFDLTQPTVGIPSNEIIIHTDSIRDYGIVFTESYEESGTINHIYRFDFTNSKLEPESKKIISTKLNLQKPISSVCRWENEDFVKVYWADGENQIRVANIAPSNDEFNSTVTAEELNIVPNSSLSKLEIVRFGQGSHTAGKIQYCYQLFKVRGSETSISPLSSLIRLSKEPNGATKPIGTKPGEQTGKSVVLTSTIDNAGFDRARIISIFYKDNTSLPVIKVIDEVAITNNTISYEDKGNNFINELSIDEFNTLVGYLFTAKVLETKDNILFAADITEDTWDVEYDARAYRCDNGGNVLLGSYSGEPLTFFIGDLNENTVPKEHDCINEFVSDVTSPYKYARTTTGSYVFGGTGVNVSYTFVTTDFIEDKSLSRNKVQQRTHEAISHTANIGSVNLTEVGTNTKSTYPLASTNLRNISYRDATMDSIFRSYQRDEVYRFGIVFYNEKNMASTVHWIGDIRMPDMNECPTFSTGVRVDLTNGTSLENVGLVTHPLGVKFDVRNIPAGVTGFEIVRCDRTAADRRILAQGVLSRTAQIGNTGGNTLTNEIRPYHFMTWGSESLTGYTTADTINTSETLDTHHFKWPRTGAKEGKETRMTPDVFQFICPEIAVMRRNAANTLSEANGIDSFQMLLSVFNNTTGTSGNWSFNDRRTFHDQNYIQTGGNIYQNSNGVNFVKIPSYSDSSSSIETGSNKEPSHLVGKYYVAVPITRKTSTLNESVYAGPLNSIVNWDELQEIKSAAPMINNHMYVNLVYTLINGLGSDYRRGSKVGLGSPSLVVYSDNLITNVPPSHTVLQTADYAKFAETAVVLSNIVKPSAMYGGTSFTSRQNSAYISVGAYKKVSGDSITVDVFGGDTYINIFDYAHTTYIFHPDRMTIDLVKDVAFQTMALSLYIPVESSINLAMRYDEARSTYNNIFYRQNDIASIAGIYTQSIPAYAYNDVYSVEGTVKQFVNKGLYSIDNLHTDSRIIASEAKTNLEVSDSWTKFKVANYIDLDTRYGSVNNLVTFNNTLYFWQTDGFGQVAVNERSIITDNNPGALVLGTGDVLSRYDYVTTKNGSKDKSLRNITTSDSTIYWYDADRAETCGFDGNLQTLSKLKGVQSYLNKGKVEQTLLPNPNVVYDKKYNEVLFTLDDKTLVFNEQLGVFTSFYNISPDWYIEFTDDLYTFKNNKLYRYNSGDNKSLYTDTSKWMKLHFVVNDQYDQTKTFDNVEFAAYPTPGTNLTNIVFETKRQRSFVTMANQIDNREDTYKFAIPRSDRELTTMEELVNKSYRDRMKGKYLLSKYEFDSNNEKQIKIPYISTVFRASMI